mmetsp:Transcript_5351/g.7742  ORF Transcript_5351/g.7742 Transcript_5351/m.7742 type:complete len:356 (-) Transcript_5351:148-1215(-)
MKAISKCVFMLASGLALPVVGRSDIFCLTRDDCKKRQNELGLKKFKSGRYSNMGRGCFSKFDTLYWSTGGSYEEKTTYDLGWSAKVRVTCGEAEQISTVAPSDAPTTTPVITDKPTKSTIPTYETSYEPTYEREHEVATNFTSAPILTSNNTVYQNSTIQDDSDVKLTESVFTSGESSTVEVTNNTSNETNVGKGDVQVEVAEAYLTDSKPAKASYRFLEIGVAVFSVGLLFVAAMIHRSRQRTKSQKRDNEPIADVSVENSRSDSFDTENVSTNALAQNMIEIAEAASENTDGMSCWIPTDYNQHSLAASTSFGDGTSELMWSSVATSESASIGTESTYTEEGSVKTTKISNIT